MDIAFLGYENGVDPTIIGGTQSYLRRLTEQLSANGHLVDVFVYGASGISNIDLQPFREVFFVRSLSEASKIMQAHGPYDSLIVTNFPPRWFLHQLAQFPRWRRSCRSIGYLFVVRSSNRLMRFVKIFVARFWYDFVISSSRRLQKESERFGSNAYLVLPPVPEVFYVAHRAAVGNRKITVAYIGRISQDKGVDRLIPSFEDMRKNVAGVDVRIYGYHNAEDENARWLHERLLASKEIDYFPTSRSAAAQSDSYVARILRENDILVLPYRELSGETLDVPLLVLEAIASGCVVIATDVGDIPEIINDERLIMTDERDLLNIVRYLIQSGGLVEKRKQLTQKLSEMSVSQKEAGDRLIRILQENAAIVRNL